MENRSHALAAGLFVLVLTAALAAIGLWFSKDDGHVLTPYVVTTTGDVSGLKPEAPVRYRGVDVGKVYAIRLDPARPGVIEIRIGVDAATPVTSTTLPARSRASNSGWGGTGSRPSRSSISSSRKS